MNWEILVFISIVTTSIAALFERVLMKDDNSDPISYAIFFQFIVGLITFLFSLLFGKFVLPHDPHMWFRYILSTLLWAGATVASLNAMKRLPVGEAIIIGSSSGVFTIILAILFLGEKLTPISILGSFLIYMAIWLVYSQYLTFNSRTGVLFALLSAILGGVAVVNDTIILKTYEAFSFTTIMFILPGILLLLIFPKHIIGKRNLFKWSFIKAMLLLAVFYSIQAITYYLALEQHAPISKLSLMTKSSIILTVILGVLFLKEKSMLVKKLIAAIIVTIGAILVG